MPPPKPVSWLNLIMPWRYERPWSRIVGSCCLVLMAVAVLYLIVGGRLLEVVLDVVLTVVGILALIDTVRFQFENRKFKRTLHVFAVWRQVINGEVNIEDLPPEMQEEIAVRRAMNRTDFPRT